MDECRVGWEAEPMVVRCPPSGGAADDPPLATVETSDPTGSLT